MCCWSQTVADVVRQEQKGEEAGAGPCPHEPAGRQGDVDSGRDSGHVQEGVGVALHRRPSEGAEEDSTCPLVEVLLVEELIKR